MTTTRIDKALAAKPRARQRGAQALVVVAGIAVAAIAAAAVGYWYGTRHGSAAGAGAQGGVVTAPDATRAGAAEGARAGGSVGEAAADGRRVLYWHDPMVPGQRFDKPGRSPFMDMDLVPVYADEGADEGQLTISPRLVQNLGIRTVEVREATLDVGFTAVGTIGVDERSIVAVQARSPGFVERLLVRAQYDAVAAGAPLAELYVPEWLAGEEELLALKASAQPGAAALADAARQRLRLLGVPEGEIARVEREGKASARVTVRAPEAGIVWEIGARDGMAVMPGTTLYRLASIASVWVIAEVPEAQAALARAGAAVEVRAAAYPERVFRGSVGALLPEVNMATRTVRARIVVANPGGLLKPGMFATVAFGGEKAKPVVVVPAEAVIRTGRRDVVIVALDAGKYEPVQVETGRESGELVEIRKGLRAGQRVVASGQFLVDSEANLKGALARLDAGGDAANGKAGEGAGGKAGGGQAGAPAAPVHPAEGVVQALGPEITIKHGPIPTAGMGGMTMAFKAPKAGTPPDVKVGTAVRFEFVLTPQGEMQLVSIVPTAPSAAGGASPAPAAGREAAGAVKPATPASAAGHDAHSGHGGGK